jgi:threonine dehydratase
MTTSLLPTLQDVRDAQRRLIPFLTPTPLLRSEWLSSVARADVRLKIESLQSSRSFKIRGALNALLRLSEAVPGEVRAAPEPRTIVTASAGNHGRAVALAAAQLNFRAVVFAPATAPETKKRAIRRQGADLRDDAPDYDAAERAAREYAAAIGAPYVSPYNDADVIAGAGTAALELIDTWPDCDVIVVPLGGGGLASGVALAVKSIARHISVIGVEVEASMPFAVSLAAGAITKISPGPSLADGLVGNLEPGSLTFDLVRQHLDRVVSVTEHDVAFAIRGLAEEEHVMAEGAGATATAAILAGPVVRPGQRATVMMTGGNIDLARFISVVATV